MKVIIKNHRRKVFVEAKEMGYFSKGIGLMFSKNPEPLFFGFRKDVDMAIHSYFCKSFLAIWLDADNNVLEKKVVKPWQWNVRPGRKFRNLVEIPLNKKNGKILDFFVDKGKI